MGFREVELKQEYRSFKDNIVDDFYLPVLSESVLYRRAVGFFSSSSMAEIAKGIGELLNNGGRMELIASPRLSDEDIRAIELGYKMRDEIIEEKLMNELLKPKNKKEEYRLNLLAHLISKNKLDIKIAILNKNNKIGIYHEKLGILYDSVGNKIVFTGSLNETANALLVNYESIDVFTSWFDEDRVIEKEKSFVNIWDNKEKGLEILEFPKVKKAILDKYKKENIDAIFEKEGIYTPDIDADDEIIICKNTPHIPLDIVLHDYQEEAIKNWSEKDFCGIFDMATGTGKTFTGIGGLIRLYEKKCGKLGVVIVCPYTHLVEQWVDELKIFGIEPIVAYSESKDRNYKKKIKESVLDYNLKVIKHFCIITTNATYRTEDIQLQLRKINRDALLIIDEAHNFGATNLRETLLKNFKYRLGLSATLKRHNDEEGTKALYDYFGETCIEYTLERAIKEKKLTPYYYYPIPVYLSDNELYKYKELSRDIGKNIIKMKSGAVKLNEKGKMLALERSRLVAGAINKASILFEKISKYKNDSHILVYCGATTLFDNDEYEETNTRQIDYITKMLGNKLDMKVSQFTSKENNDQRKKIKERFSQGDDLQVLIAIKCLDEGVNIPSIKTAFILASTTNPKEFIQRRGRVLRRAPGKKFAEIYDFITLPRDLDTVKGYTANEVKIDKSLVLNEIKRIIEFRDLSLNPCDSDILIQDIQDAYELEIGNISDEIMEENGYGIE